MPCIRRPFLVPFLLLFLVLPAGCDWITGSDPAPTPPPEITELPRALTPAETQILRASAGFGLDLLRQVVADAPDSTHVVSPFSASMALGMALNAAGGTTFDEMRTTLGFGVLDQDAINRSYRDLLALLVELDPAVSLSVANAVWYDRIWTLRTSFREAVEAHFAAGVEGLDFRDPGTPDRMDAWVNEATRGRISTIAPRPIPDDAVAYLVNALHFLGDWREAFDPARTRTHVFQGDDGRTTPIRLMEREGRIRTSQWQGHRAADLPYGGGAWTMTVVLPRPGVGVVGLLEELDAEGWAALTSEFSEFQGILGLPRFTLAWEGRLNDALSRMGMPTAFAPGQADFSGLVEEEADLYITEVRQKTFLRVDEKGTEAAAVTSVGIGVTSLPPSFVVDRPFLLVIRERLSGTVLFLGAMVEPPLDG
jgi:serine protease inhibitor